MRLIDVDAVRDDFANAVYNELFEHKDKYRANRIIDIFCSLPKIEAEPVKHGNWVDGDYCSICNISAYEGLDADIFSTYCPPFCPNCGAKMNGGD